ncbi:uncharacterized protein LOC8279482 [Ricinus communis]|uniref:Uncharacterized protein n=1 Tax=Ricinus communis TaxID=3988 RepID=B9RZ72_RICCO|nr:uncharacterized protein LOC8279482 [Ricinus communis]EEF43252.1 conserved hypothetical protein [Ricinus communis]|eukprot:XP_002519041.1 uncharacterized protein LOC8279482 [Ricinus communis]
MKTLTFANPTIYTNSKFSPSIFLLSLSQQNTKVFGFSLKKSLYIFKTTKTFPVIKASATTNDNSLNYGGWDDFRLGGDLPNSGESSQVPYFLVSRGIDDSKKYIFVFFLGIFCAFAISRVRVSSIIVFPASVLIFAIGFSLGFFRGGNLIELSANASKKRAKDEIFRVCSERLRSLVGFFDGFDVKVNDLKNYIQRVIDTKEIELGDLENYISVIESLQASALNSRNVVESTIVGVGNSSSVLAENQKSSVRKKKEIGEVGFGLLQFVGGLFGEKLVDSKPPKVKDKDNAKQGLTNDQSQGNDKVFANDQTQVNSSTQQIRLNIVDNDQGNNPSMFSQGLTNKSALDWDTERRIRIMSENAKMNTGETGGNWKRFIDSQEYSYQSSRLQFVDNQRVSWTMNKNNETEMWKSRENWRDSVDLNFSFKHAETEASFVQEQMLKQSSGAYKPSKNRNVNEDKGYRSQFREEEPSDDSRLPDNQSVMEGEVGSSSSSMLADDVVFDRYLSEANNLLKQAKECIKGKHDEEHAEIILYKSAKLLAKALAMKPMSLLAVGLLGNTYLLHGELKLKISRELRTLLSRKYPISVDSRGNTLKGLDEQVPNKDKIASALIHVCEECEELLVEAGRKYRLALSIDGNDVRALYNWGLALSFRAQLISDIGPEAAFDADKVFLAAIDKFDAMMSKGNVYAPDALYRWGVVLQQRSRLRPRNSKEKVKLLMQAKRLYEDALNMEFDNLQVREAISSCVAELNHRHF